MDVEEPAARDSDGDEQVDVTVVHGSQSAPLDANGIGQLSVLRGAVVDLKLQITGGDEYLKYNRVVPGEASVNWEEMEVSTTVES